MKITEVQEQTVQLNAQLSLQSDKFDFMSAKLKDVTTEGPAGEQPRGSAQDSGHQF